MGTWWVVCNREIITRENTRHGETAFQRIASRKNGERYHVNVMVEQSCDQRDTCIPFFAVRSVLGFFLYIYIPNIQYDGSRNIMHIQTYCLLQCEYRETSHEVY